MNTPRTNQTTQASDVADVTDVAPFTKVTDLAFGATDAETSVIDTAEADLPALPAMRILRIAECASLSGRSTLTYHIGCSNASNASEASQDSQESHLRLFDNSAKGYFCKDWVSMVLIDLLLAEATSFTSGDVQRLLFEGKSVNSGGFLLAALRNEGLIRTSEGSLRSYEPLDATAWHLEIQALIDSGVALSEHQTVAKQVKPAKPIKTGKAKAAKA